MTEAAKIRAVRLADILGGLSLACDLADGFAPEKALRSVVFAMELARAHGIPARDLHDLYYVTLLRYLGCTGFAHEETHHYGAGDDIATRYTMSLADPAQPFATVSRIVNGIGRSGPVADGARAVARILGDGVALARHARAQCETSVRLAQILGLGSRVQTALNQVCERWDGRGAPAQLRDEALDPIVRVQTIADVLEIVHAERGREATIAEAERRAGGHFDPALVRTFRRHANDIFERIEQRGALEAFLASEPAPHVVTDETRLDDVTLAFACFADLKSCFTLGHSTGVAELAESTARSLGASPAEAVLTRRAAMLHDVGRVAVSNVVWDKPARLSAHEWERARMHAYYTERVLWQSLALRDIGVVAAAAHERLDGGGYHRALSASSIGIAARALAVADAYHAMLEPRPHRPALRRDAAEKALREDARAARLDAAAVRALLDAVGTARAPKRAPWPKGLSDREVEVLRVLARGRTNKEIASALGLSPKTVQHHVAHVYAKIGVESRAGAALFAVENGLLAPD